MRDCSVPSVILESTTESRARIGSWRFSGRLGRLLRHAFDLQMWCLGCDIRQGPRNLLVEYGFSRDRPPAGVTGSSHYHRFRAEGGVLHLWGFGACFVDRSGVLSMRRYDSVPRYSEHLSVIKSVWRPQDLSRLLDLRIPSDSDRVVARTLLSHLVNELLRYEEWIASKEGGARYRFQCERGYRTHRLLRGVSAREVWSDLLECV